MNLRILLIFGWIYILSGCATFVVNDPLRISVAGMEPLEGKGMEARFAVQLRMQNHGDKPLDYDGVALDLDLRGMSFASGVSDQRGTIPRYGETIITVPVTVPATAIIRHVFGFATGDQTRVDYRLRGQLGGAGFGGGRNFDSQGEITLPTVPPETGRPDLWTHNATAYPCINIPASLRMPFRRWQYRIARDILPWLPDYVPNHRCPADSP